MEAILIITFFLLGMSIASFLNVCIDRLPAHQSLVYPPSHCAACNRRLAAKDLIPVFSYLWLRGRCRYCGAAIPRRILWMELGTAVLFGLACWRFEVSIELAVALFYICLFMVLMVIDWEKGLILNKIVFPAIVASIVISAAFSLFLPDIEIVPFIGRAAIGGGIGLVIFFLIVIVSRGGMGWGDVKLAALIGLVTGFPLVFIALLIGVVLGGVVAALLLVFKIKKRKEAIPFGPFLAIAAIATLLWGNSILSWYRGLF
ncbi:MAG: prepilin peptidase [Dehalococcoidales bacterium]|nr:prepilin peptidase [Dehalococcoidales bacterium]